MRKIVLSIKQRRHKVGWLVGWLVGCRVWHPGPGNFAPFLMMPVPVPEKIGPGKKYRYRSRKKMVLEKSTGTGPGKNCSRVIFLTSTMSAAGVCLHLLRKRKLLVEAVCEKKKTLLLQQHRHQRPITLHKSLLPPSAECTLICDSGASYNLYRLLKHLTL